MDRHIIAIVSIVTVVVVVLPGIGVAADDCVVLDLSEIEAAAAAELRAAPSGAGGWWVELGEELLVCGDLVGDVRTDRELRRLPGVDRARLAVARGLGREDLQRGGHRVLAAAHGFAVIETAPGWAPAESGVAAEPGCRPPRIDAIAPGAVVLRRSDLGPESRRSTVFSPETAAVVAAVDPTRWLADVVTLAGWDRFTHRSEILLARDWLAAELSGLGLAVTAPSFQVGGTTAFNVVGVLPGRSRPDDWVLVGGHYDATAPSYPAPGAEDNASGCAGVLELARVLVPASPEATVIFICWSGEEQGMVGSEDHAGDLVASGDDDKVVGVVNMDMIGYTGDSELDVLLESEDPLGESVVTLLEDAAAAFSGPVTYLSWDAWGSDHVSYLDRGMPAVLTIENDWNEYPSYHSSSDLPGNLSEAMGGAILRMNAAAAAHLAGAGGGPLFADGFESGTLTPWTIVVGGR